MREALTAATEADVRVLGGRDLAVAFGLAAFEIFPMPITMVRP